MIMQPDSPTRPRGFALLLHSLAPTASSFIVYFVIAVVFIVAHLVALSVNGTAYPEHLNDEFLMGYANFIIQPLLVFVNHSFVNSALTLVIWAIMGSTVAALLGAAATALNDWRNTRDDVAISPYGVVIHHPMQHSFIMRFFWRAAIGVAIVCYTIFALTVVRHCFANDLSILGATHAGEVAWRFVLGTIIWMLVFHGYIILLRLYVQRTRLLGEILY
jgi:hypothetical protein